MQVAAFGDFKRFIGRAVIDMPVPDFGNRCEIAAAHAGRAQHADVDISVSFKFRNELLSARKGTAKGLTDPDGNGGRALLAVADDVEMRIEGRDFIDLRHGNAHLGGQCVQQTGR